MIQEYISYWVHTQEENVAINLDLPHSGSSEFPEPVESSGDTEIEESSPEVPSDLEDIVMEILAELAKGIPDN